jgi:UTP--glucose-1-phosphate uridylyltransferase
VLPVAGLGTRLLPATKAVPKEMLPVVDRPVIQYVVDEARAAGIEHFIFVTGRNKGAIEDHFDVQFELEATLRDKGRADTIKALARDLPEPGQLSFIRQRAPLGLGHAIWCARQAVGDEPFAVLLPDMISDAKPGFLSQLVEAYGETGGNFIAVEECDPLLTGQYGVVAVGEATGDAFRITAMVEKPEPRVAPSNLFINGRYILQPSIFRHLAESERGAGNEIQLTDAMVRLALTEPFHGLKVDGRSYDCGSRIGYLAANVAFALARPDLADEFSDELRRIMAPPRTDPKHELLRVVGDASG